MTITYEWDLETWDSDFETNDEAECLDHQYGDKLRNVPFPVVQNEKLVLVRDCNGYRLWAYVDKSRMLPRHFSKLEADGKYYETDVKIPKRFHLEITREMCR